MRKVVLETVEQVEEWQAEHDWPDAFARDVETLGYVIFHTEDGDVMATRPLHEDDPYDPEHPKGGVTVPLDTLPLPVTIWELSNDT